MIAISDSLRRISIHIDRRDRPVAVDVVLPAELRVGDAIVSIVDLGGIAGGDLPTGWRLARVGGPALDESMTLGQHDIHDGDLLVLSTVQIPAPLIHDGRDLAAAVAAVAAPHRPASIAAAMVGLWAIMSGAAVLVWMGARTGGAGPAVTASVLAAGAGIAALTAHFAHRDAVLCRTGGVATVVLAAVAGFLIVPGGPAAPNALLAAGAASSVSMLLLRVTGRGTVWLTAAATAATLIGLGATAAVVWPIPTAVAGAAVATASLGALGVAARLAAVLSRLSPALPAGDGPLEETGDGRELRGHRVLTGLVIGLAGSAVSGVLVAAINGAPIAGVTFTAVLGLALALRARSHTDPCRRAALVISGIACVTIAFIVLSVAVLRHGHWCAAVAVGAGLAMLAPLGAAMVNPMARRAVDVLEYFALGAVVPSACWVADLFALVRGASLT